MIPKRLLLLAACALPVGLYALAGFFLAPWLVERHAPAYALAHLGVELKIADVDFNPFLLRFEAHDLRLLQKSAPDPMLTASSVGVDLAWESLWASSWVVSEVRIQGMHALAKIGPDGRLNWSALSLKDGGTDAAQQRPTLSFDHIAVHDARVRLADLRVGPRAAMVLEQGALTASDLTTARLEREPTGRYAVNAILQSGGRIGAKGSLSLAPGLRSTGEFSLVDAKLPAIWPLLRGLLGIELEPVADTLSVRSNYIYSNRQPTPEVLLEGIAVEAGGVVLRPLGKDAAALLRLKSIGAGGGRFDLAARKLDFSKLELRHGALATHINAEGRLDWERIGGSPASSRRPSEDRDPGAGADGDPWQIGIASLGVEGVALHASDGSRPLPVALDVEDISGRAVLAATVGSRPAHVQVSGLSAQLERPRLTAVHSSASDATQDALLAFDRLSLTQAALDTRTRHVAAENIAGQGGRAEIEFAPTGPPGLLQAFDSGGKSDGDQLAAWSYAIDAASADGLDLVLRDSSVRPAVQYRAELASTTVHNIASNADTPVRVDLNLKLEGGGTVRAEGTVAQDGGTREAALTIARLPLLPLQPLLAEQARLELRSGLLSAELKLTLDRDGSDRPALRASGTASARSVNIHESGSGDRFLSWNLLQAKGIAVQTAPARVRIEQIELDEPGAKLVISKDRSVNLSEVIRNEARPTSQAADVQPPAATTRPLEVLIERIAIRRGELDFADLSLVLPFSTRVSQLQGTIVNVSTGKGERARVQARGNIGEFGSATVRGSLIPFAPRQFLALDVRMENVALPPFSPYTATFAGRKIAEGKLWLDLDYRIEDGRLAGKNRISLSDFRLGERVEAPDALDLPLELAVALLTDEEGKIELTVPVSGKVGSRASFDVSGLVAKAIGKSLKRIVSAPFRALGRLFGSEEGSEELAKVEFAPGSSVLRPPQREKLLNVGRAVAKRPKLQLLVDAPYSPARDGDALRRREARHELANVLGHAVGQDGSAGLVAFASKRVQRALEGMLRKYGGIDAVATARSEAPGDEYGSAIFKAVVAHYPLPDTALSLLATRRAAAIRDYLVDQTQLSGTRLRTGRIAAVADSDDASVGAALTLAAAIGY